MTACERYNKPTNLHCRGIVLPPYTGIGSDLDLCRNCRSNRQADVWEAAPDWNALLHLNLLFLRDEVDVNVNHLGPLNEEIAPLVPGLIRLHEYGILTCDYQSFKKSSQYHVGKCWLQTRQRPYLHFMLPTLYPDITIDNADTFIERLFEDASILVSVYSECDEYIKTEDTMRSKRLTPVTMGRARSTYRFRTNASWSKDCLDNSTGENFHRPDKKDLEKFNVLPLHLRSLLEHWQESVRQCK